MVRINLKKLISKKDFQAVIKGAISALDAPIAIRNIEGVILLGQDSHPCLYKYPVVLADEVIGYVTGSQKAKFIADLIGYAAQADSDTRTLAMDTLEKYEEVNFLYDFSSKISSCLGVSEVTDLVVTEAKKLIDASNISLMLVNPKSGKLEVISARGKKYNSKTKIGPNVGIAGHILVSGKAEIVNDVLSDPRYVGGNNNLRSLICAPLTTQNGTIGVINVSNNQLVNYTAQDLKLLTALASQAAAAIENALLHESKLKEERIKNNLERYLSPHVVQAVIEAKGEISLSPTKRNITVLFSDIRDFTTKCEELPAEKIVLYLNEYFTQMVEVIFSKQGTVNKFVGDMIVAMFGAPSEVAERERKAIETAIDMQRRIEEISIPWIRDNFLTGIGISAGEVVVGNIGSPQHMDYTAIGDEVNIASRLQSIAKGKQILVSDSVYSATKDMFEFKEMGQVIVKGKKKAVKTFEVIYQK
ncbi:MAG: GAF domain-containing protein [Oscillatoriales cyanobacterium]|uniref:Adenylate/guanylate cyclase domain-containing protein n=1 Tax=Microcoleus anatoxicus PTRS2 TaxID=2705321 RepID=A0ABU8YK60_9CYAN|nr:MAG: GAF domain-containing protein [Oscillatoriales cyanobacterium]TAD96764.1 MAG: GAF domain-containing protein [Oscillatoriales cyanobacterium]TAE04478.1 MAG: GAF domain-containing protein [Oscillatoriales cyanobacterium]TAF06555.1 MAG: GAF domain-containing protein [Oscillatoriales cyanobacterium]TAF44974.1 MAG: GAF domain-containing protein [Oscillatoriales cyanobacterium]